MVDGSGMADGDGGRLLDRDGSVATIGRTSDDGRVTVEIPGGVTDVRRDVETISPGCTAVLPTIGRDVVLVISAVICSCGGGKCCGFSGNLLGVVLFGDVAVVDGKHLGRGNKNCLLRWVT
jgi:hypothetical protein